MMKFNRIKRNLLFAAMALMAVHCTENPPANAALEKAKARNKEVIIRREVAITSLNPLLPMNGYSRMIAQQIFQTLGTFDPETYELQPLLAKSIPTVRKVTEGKNAGCYAYDVEINELATWDNGTPITAQDIAFTLKLILHPGISTHIWRSYFSDLKEFELDPANPKKCTFYFKQYYFLALETICQFPVYPAYHYDSQHVLEAVNVNDLTDAKKAVAAIKANPALADYATEFNADAHGLDKDYINGSSAYKVTYIEPAQVVTIERKANWWGEKALANNKYLVSGPDKISYKTIKDEGAAINQLMSGDIDLTMGITPAKFVELQKDPVLSQAYDFKTNWSAGYNRILFNLTNPALSDVKVRLAFSHAVDYDYIIKEVQLGLAERLLSPISPRKSYFAKDIAMYNYDIEKARALLTEAGWSDSDNNGILDKQINGKKTDLTFKVMLISGNSISEQTFASIQASTKKAGIQLDMVPTDLNTMTQKSISGDYDMVLNQSALQPGVVELYQQYHSSQIAPKGDNRSRLAVPELDKAIEMIRTTEDEAARTPHYITAQRIIHEQAPEIYLNSTRLRYVISNRLNMPLSTVSPGYNEQYISFK